MKQHLLGERVTYFLWLFYRTGGIEIVGDVGMYV